MSRRAVRVAAVALMVGAALAVFAGPREAAAHSSLIGTSPKEGGTVTSPVKNVQLRFNDEIQSKFATVAVTGPDGRKVSSGKPAVSGDTVEQPVTAFHTSGRYLVGWRVVSADGHPVSGKFAFTVTKAAVSRSPSGSASATPKAATPKASTAGAASRQQPPDDRTFVERHASHLLIGAVIVLAGVAVVIWERRRRHD